MAAPNTLIPRAIISRTTPVALTSSFADVVANPADSGKVVQVKGLLVSNSSGAELVASFQVVRGTTVFPLRTAVAVAGGGLVPALPTGEEIRLEEGDKLQGKLVSGTGGTAFCTHNVTG